jgi:molecular chaperone GrpE
VAAHTLIKQKNSEQVNYLMAREKKKQENKKEKYSEEVMGEKEDLNNKRKENDFSGEETVAEEEISIHEKDFPEWQKEKDDLLDQLKRKQADIDNLRRIGKMEQAEAREYALHEFLCRLLPVLDNMERGLEAARAAEDVPSAYIEGLEMIRKQLLQILDQEEVSVIEAVGTAFDPNCHHAVMQVDDHDSEPGSVLEELQKGYRHRKRILRPAMVKVCREQ